MRRLTGVVVSSMVGVLVACAHGHTDMATNWKSPEATAAALSQRVLVLALVPNLGLRGQVEKSVTAKLNEGGGFQAAPASQYLPAGSPPTAGGLENLARAQGFNSVLVVKFQGFDRTNVVPTSTTRFADYMATLGPMVYIPTEVTMPGPKSSSEIVAYQRGQVSLLNLRREGQLLWTATSDSLESGTAASMVPAFADAVAKQLQHDLSG